MSISVDIPLVVGFLRRAIMDGVPPWPLQLLVVAAAVLSIGVLYRHHRPNGAIARRLRSRLLLGVPWGTLLAVAFLLAVYLFVQGAYSGDIFDPQAPVTYPFVAYSFEYPLGIVTAAFSHQNFNHLLGNAISLVVFGAICEYAVGHFPHQRGTQAGGDWRSSPYGRPLAIFLVILLSGLALTVATPGPIIGFSGVVYALAGFALLVRPLSAVAALLATDVLRLLYNAFTTPVSAFATGGLGTRTVWFADISAIGHFLGFLVGVLVAVAYLRRRESSPSRSLVFGAVLTYGLVQQLWLVYWPAGDGQFVLHRAAGVALVFGVATVVVLAIGEREPLVPTGESVPSKSTLARTGLVTVVLSCALAGVALNTTTFEGTDLPNDPVEVRDYQIGYAENVTDQLYSVEVPLVDLPQIEAQTAVETSGVIVTSERRHVWDVHTTADRLAQSGVARVRVGGVGWRETVWVTRTTWTVVGGEQTYRVSLYPPDSQPRLAYTSEPATAEAIIANRSITLRPAETDFEIAVSRNTETLGVAAMPEDGGSVTVGDIRFDRRGRNLFANYDGTRVRIANKKIPPLRRN